MKLVTSVRLVNNIREVPTRRPFNAPVRAFTAGVTAEPLRLKELSSRIGPEVLEGILRRAMALVANRASELVPVKTGLLKSTIRLKVLRDGQDRIWVYVTAGSYEAFYAAFVEFGTAGREAKSYLRPAWDEMKDIAKMQVIKEISMRISKRKGGTR